MTTILNISEMINSGTQSGQVIGKGRKAYTLWNWEVFDEYKIRYTHIKTLSPMLEKVTAQYPEILIYEGLTSDWRTQAFLTHLINQGRNSLKNAAAEAAQVIPFGKYKGIRVDSITDLSYLCWLANQKPKGVCNNIKKWLKTAVIDRARYLGAVEVGGLLIDLEDQDNQFNKNTSLIYKAVKSNEPIEYIAEQNDGGLWNAYNIILPIITVGHPYYGAGRCLDIDGRAKRAKGFQITIYDYIVNDNTITANRFYANRV